MLADEHTNGHAPGTASTCGTAKSNGGATGAGSHHFTFGVPDAAFLDFSGPGGPSTAAGTAVPAPVPLTVSLLHAQLASV